MIDADLAWLWQSGDVCQSENGIKNAESFYRLLRPYEGLPRVSRPSETAESGYASFALFAFGFGLDMCGSGRGVNGEWRIVDSRPCVIVFSCPMFL